VPARLQGVHTEDFGQVAFTIEAQPGCPIHLTKYMVYHTSQTASPKRSAAGGVDMDRVMQQGSSRCSPPEQYMKDFCTGAMSASVLSGDRVKRTTVEIQQAIRFNLLHILSLGGGKRRRTGESLTGQAYEDIPFGIPRSTAAVSGLYLPPDRQESADLPLQDARAGKITQALAIKRHVPMAHHQRRRSVGYYAAGTAATTSTRHHVRAAQICARDGTTQFLQDCGAEMLVETAPSGWTWILLRPEGGEILYQWRHRADEYKTVVNNNAYTNVMARENLRYAAETVASCHHTPGGVQSARIQDRARAVGVEAWTRAAERMYVPYDEQEDLPAG